MYVCVYVYTRKSSISPMAVLVAFKVSPNSIPKEVYV